MATPTTLPAAFVAGNVLEASQLNALRGAFRVLQTVSTTKTDTFTMNSTTFTDVTGLSVSITPQSTSSKILVFVSMMIGNPTTEQFYIRLLRGSTAISLGDTAGSRTSVTTATFSNTQFVPNNAVINFLDSPSTTSATTYKIQIASTTPATIAVNRTADDSDSAGRPRGTSSITVMEISA
jgi:hypothetical protein